MHVDHASDEPGALNPISRLHTMRASHPKIRAQVDVHLITSPQTHRKAESTTVQEQSNLHRNTARFFARTDFVMLMEADGSMPMTDVAKSFKERPQWMEKLRSGNVFVVPGFDVSKAGPETEATSDDNSNELVPVLKANQLPRSKDALLTQVHESQVMLSEKTWKRTIRNVDYNTWATQQSRLSSIQNYDPFFAPSVILRRDKMLWCPERFGNNQAACLFELYLSGADFWVLPNDFTVNSGERKEAIITEREVLLHPNFDVAIEPDNFAICMTR